MQSRCQDLGYWSWKTTGKVESKKGGERQEKGVEIGREAREERGGKGRKKGRKL